MSKKIAIVDDETHIRALLEQTLEELEEDHGVELLTASDGREALALIQEERPQLVFLDVMMPHMNGYDVCQNVTQDPAMAETKVVLLTAKGQEADRKRGLEVGATEYMTKPFDPDDVVDLAKQLLELED